MPHTRPIVSGEHVASGSEGRRTIRVDEKLLVYATIRPDARHGPARAWLDEWLASSARAGTDEDTA